LAQQIGKELSGDCLKLPDSVVKNKQTDRQTKGVFGPQCHEAAAGNSSSEREGWPWGLVWVWRITLGQTLAGNREIHGDENSFKRGENGNMECPFLHVKYTIQRTK